MKVFSFLIILIVSIILSSKTESEACIWRNWFCDWITGRNNNDGTTAPSYTEDEKMQAIRNIADSIHNFSETLEWAITEKMNETYITSPLSAAMVLMMAAYGANDENAKKMNSMLHFDTNNNTYKTGIYSLIEMFDALNPSQLELANKIYAGKNQDLNPDFKSLVNQTFKSTIENVDFGLSESAAKKIDNWRAEKNHHRLRNVIKSDEISADTEFLFTNSLYFSALWKEPFNKTNTKPMKFNISDGKTIEKSIMYRDMPVAYISSADQKIYVLELQKRDSNDYKYEVALIFPSSFNPHELKELALPVPKFRIESTINLEDVLNQLKTNFSGISNQSYGLRMNKVVQKFTLEINESGIEAAIYSEASFDNKTGNSDPALNQDRMFNKYPMLIVISYADTVLLFAYSAEY